VAAEREACVSRLESLKDTAYQNNLLAEGVTYSCAIDAIRACANTDALEAVRREARVEAAEGVQITPMPPECAPKGAPVLVAGGIAMKKTGGQWFTGMEEPAFEHPIQWEVKWWAPIPEQNEPPSALTPAPVSVEEAARTIMHSKNARDMAFDAMWVVAEKHSLEATNAGGARYSITGDVVNELYYAAILALITDTDKGGE